MAKKLIPLSRVAEIREEMDTVASSIKKGDGCAIDVLYRASEYWYNMYDFRKERERCKNFNYGEQWKDTITVNGKQMSEEEYILQQGNMPLKNNLIRRLVRNVVGVYRQQSKEPICVARDRDEQKYGETMSTVLQYNWQLNRMSELNALTFKEFLIGGLIVQKKTYGWRKDKLDCWTDIVPPNSFFVDNSMRDIRTWDVSCLGEIHDMPFTTLCREFASSPEEYAWLRERYAMAKDRNAMLDAAEQTFGRKKLNTIDFFLSESNKCRVIEVWTKELKPRYRCHDLNSGELFKIEESDYYEMVTLENENRIRMGLEQGMSKEEIPLIQATWFMDDYWYYRFMTPLGDILKEGESPYEHKEHPYIFRIYPGLDGEIHSFVSDVIDQQKYVNRLISLYDMMMRASAKGLLLIPEESISEKMNVNDIAEQWGKFDGVVIYKSKGLGPSQRPMQVSSNATNIGISELLNLQLKFFEDISGVAGALQGKPGYSGTSGSLYAQQTQNATTSLLDMLESFSSFVVDCAYKDVKNIQQYYDSKRVFNIAGRSGAQVVYDPKKIKDIEFDLSIVESSSTPVIRQLSNDFLKEIWASGQITLKQMLEVGDFPFADALLESIKSQEQQINNGEVPQGIPPELLQQAQQGADMNAVQNAYNLLHRGIGE